MLQRTADILESSTNINQHNMTQNQQIMPAAADHQQYAATVPFWSPQQPFWTPQQRQALAKLFIGGTSSNMNFHPSLINASINGHGQDQNLGPSSNSLHSDQQIRSTLSPYACAANANGYSSAGESQPNSRKSSLDSTASNAQLQQQHFYSSSVNFGQNPMAISVMHSGGQQQPPQSSSSSSLYWPSNDLFAFGLQQQMHQLPTAQTPIGVQQLQIALAQQAQHGSLAMGIGPQQQQLAPLLPQALLLTQTTKAKLPALRSGHLEMLKWIKDKVQSPIIDFLCEMLADPDQYGHICAFIADREFRINSTKTFTDLLNLRTNQHARSYLKVARAMKSYEERRLNGQVMMRKIADKRNQFKFFPDLP